MPAEEPMYERSGRCLVDRIQNGEMLPLSDSVPVCGGNPYCGNKVATNYGLVDPNRARTIRSGCVRTLAWMSLGQAAPDPEQPPAAAPEAAEPVPASMTETLATAAIANA